MPIIDYRKQIETDLVSSLMKVIPSASSDDMNNLMENLTSWIDQKIEDAKDDVVDRVKGRGQYDPDY